MNRESAKMKPIGLIFFRACKYIITCIYIYIYQNDKEIKSSYQVVRVSCKRCVTIFSLYLTNTRYAYNGMVSFFRQAVQTSTPGTVCLKKGTVPLYALCQFVKYKLKIVTHVYMKL